MRNEKGGKLKRFFILFSIAAFSLLYADAVIENYTKISMIGGMGSIESQTKTEIKGLKKAEDATVKMTGGILGAVAGKHKRQVTIIRLDKDVIWNINHNQKTYTESPIAFPDLTEEAKTEKVEKPEYEIVKSEFSVKNTGNKKEINGFACQEYVANWLLAIMKIETKEKTKSTMMITLWATPKNDLIKEFEKQENEFNKQLLAKIGTRVSPEQMKRFGAEFITSMFSIEKDEVNKKMVNLSDELKKIEGYPIVTEIKWTLEGEKSKKETMTEEEEEMPKGMGEAFAQALAKKGEKKAGAETEPAFYSYVEVKSIKLSEVPEKDFEVPQGYKLVK